MIDVEEDQAERSPLGGGARELRIEIVAAGLAVGEAGEGVAARFDARDLEIGLEHLDLVRGIGELGLQLLGSGEHRVSRLDHFGEHRALAFQRGRGIDLGRGLRDKARLPHPEPRGMAAGVGVGPLDIVVHPREL